MASEKPGDGVAPSGVAPDPLVRSFLDSASRRETRLFIATPCFGGMVTESYLKSMCRLQLRLAGLGIRFELDTVANESLVTRVRNALTARFLGRRDFTHLLFIDADIGFSPRNVLRLLAIDKDVAGGCYPMKSIDWDKIRQAARDNPELTGDELRLRGMRYAVNILAEERGERTSQPIRNGFVRVERLGTGFLLIRRGVFDTLIGRYPDDGYENDIAGYDDEHTRGNFWRFFDTMVHPQSRRYLSEDYAFCYKWRQCGGDIWMDLAAPLSHTGYSVFRGRPAVSYADVIKGS